MRLVLVRLAWSAVLAGSQCAAQIPAFPGADGAAANVSGGRGGIVYHVTKLNSAIDDPQRNDLGTIRYGLNNSNFPAGVPRTIVFDVGGVFSLGRLPQSGWDPNGNGWDAQSRLSIGGTNVTLAGQTAPGAGVLLMGGGLKPQGNNNIIRNITVAAGYGTRGWWKPGDPFPDPPDPLPTSLGPGIFPDATVYDAMDISGTNLMIDHVSTLYATDETISMNELSNNITVQFSNISQGQNYPQWDAESPRFTGHALGSLLEAGSGAAISFHHNLYAHQKGRVPQTQGADAYYDFRNNVFYNWFGSAGSRGGSTRLNLVGNFYLAGNGGDQPIGGQNTGLKTESGGTGVLGGSSVVHRAGNLLDTNKDGDADDGSILSGGATNPLWSGGVATYAGTTDMARDAFDRVLDYVGANWWTRDDVIDTPDERIIHEARSGTGKILAWADDPWNSDPAEGTEWRALKNTPQVNRAADFDTEPDIGYGVGDGMPTSWELQHGLDPHARDDAGDFDSDGYTNLEEYLNDLAAWPAPNAIAFNNANGDGRFAHILNWDANPSAGSVHPWQPSRFDTAVIDNGTVTVDAVGQHAGNLLLATHPGDNATLNITAGWIHVEDAPHGPAEGTTVIGDHPAATATLNLTGGKLSTKALLRGEGGTFHFTGGVLSAEMVGFDLVNQGGTISPGASPGTTLVLGDLTILAGALAIELGGNTAGIGFDQLVVTGDATLGGSLDVSVLEGFALSPAAQFEILDVVGALTGEFEGLAEGGLVGNFGQDLFITYAAGDGNDVALYTLPGETDGDFDQDGDADGADFLAWQRDPAVGSLAGWEAKFGNSAPSASAVPEPGSVAMVGLLVIAAAFRTRGRRRSQE
jgi:pectate lyase